MGYKFKDLQTVVAFDSSWLFAAEPADGLTKGYKPTVAQYSDYTASTRNYSALSTVDKTLTGAINELNVMRTDYFATGVYTGGGITATPGTTVFTIPAGTGVVWNAVAQTSIPVTWTQKTDVAVNPAYIAAGVPIVYIALAADGVTVIQSPFDFTVAQQQTYLQMGIVEISTGVISTFSNEGMNVLYNSGQWLNVLKKFLVGVSFSAYQTKYYPNGANLNIRRTATIPPALRNGVFISQGAKRDAGLAATPDIAEVTAYDQTPMQYAWLDDVGQVHVEAPTFSVVTDKYQDGSATLQTVPAGKFTVQWIVTFPTATVMVYGTKIYDSFLVAQRSMLEQRLPDILRITADALYTVRNYDNSIIAARMIIKSGETSLASSDALILNFDGTNDATFVNNINRGIISQFTVTLTGGLNIAWTAGTVYDTINSTPFSINSGSTALGDNATNYLYWDQSAQLHTLSVSTSVPQNPDVIVKIFLVENGIIHEDDTQPDLTTREADIEDALAQIHPAAAFSGMVVRGDPDVTSTLDLRMTAGSFIKDANKTIYATEILTRTTNMYRHYHTAGAPAYDTNANVDTNNYDNGTNRTASSPAKYKADWILYTKRSDGTGRLQYIYGQVQYDNVTAAITGAASIATNFPFGLPNGLQKAARLVALVTQTGDTTLPADGSNQWVDLRTSGGAGAGGATTFTALADTFAGYTKPYGLIRERSALTGLEESNHFAYPGTLHFSSLLTALPALPITVHGWHGFFDIGGGVPEYRTYIYDQGTTYRKYRWNGTYTNGNTSLTSTIYATLDNDGFSIGTRKLTAKDLLLQGAGLIGSQYNYLNIDNWAYPQTPGTDTGIRLNFATQPGGASVAPAVDIIARTNTQWTTTASTQDAEFLMKLAKDGIMGDAVFIDQDKNVTLYGNLTTATGVVTASGFTGSYINYGGGALSVQGISVQSGADTFSLTRGATSLTVDGGGAYGIDQSLRIASQPTFKSMILSGTGVTTIPTLAITGVDNNGIIAALKVTAGANSMLIDGNEIDTTDAVGGLYLCNNNSNDLILCNGGGHVQVADIRGISSGNTVFKTAIGNSILSIMNGNDVITERYYTLHAYPNPPTPASGYASIWVDSAASNIPKITINVGGSTTTYTFDITPV